MDDEGLKVISSVFEKINQVKMQLEHEQGKSFSYRETMEEMGLPLKLIDDLEKAIEMYNNDKFLNED
jgi:hypothetical protein